ncbi:MMP14 [Lepeophtheirus salmonis]|uniref:MMP14 n=1 Tax=Lepeophtheirus salmonis TaxID=72036 RepID=A0A7R8H3F4_LEPSM|nr:MMP14 [Lepeophtheirus salmonis]CAF2845220.1 MMP14 [Lepeophtheirus salmonis]
MWRALLYLQLLLLVCLNGSNSRPIKLRKDEDLSLTGAMMYLMKYGYMDNMSNSKSAPLLSPDFLKDHIMDFQGFAGLNQTGELDPLTVEYMKMPRCGVKDKVGKGSYAKRRRRKRYVLQGSRWRVRDLTYKISKYPSSSRLSRSQVDNDIAEALKVWSDYTELTFTQKESGKVHIDIRFDRREHGDGDPFDGAGGTLAHAFFPVYGGDAHFDDDENWSSESLIGTNLVQAAAHEFGHSLGLSHSKTHEALMAPFYRGYDPKLKLDGDDIKAIETLYGKRKEKKTPPTTVQSVTPPFDVPRFGISDRDEICSDSKIDSIITTKNKQTYAFKGSKYWKLTDDSIAEGYPRRISSDWEGLPPDLDAGFTWTNGRTYFFKGSKYWRFTNQNMDEGYPKLISKGFVGIPNNVDASFVWSGNGKIYFFKGSKYWRFDPEARPPVKESYPKQISNWEGIPNDLDDALMYSNGSFKSIEQILLFLDQQDDGGLDVRNLQILTIKSKRLRATYYIESLRVLILFLHPRNTHQKFRRERHSNLGVFFSLCQIPSYHLQYDNSVCHHYQTNY